MLKIPWIKIENLKEGCITDFPPNISFTLESDKSGEALANAVITCRDWKLNTTDQINNLYTGSLEPFTTYEVHVEAAGTSGDIAQASASFQTSRLKTPWKGKWITDGEYDFPDKLSPKPMTFRYYFTAKKTVKRAWVNSTALGVYELMLNGEKVGSDYFAPGFTSYEHQIQYQTYDVTRQLQNANYIIAVVAGGWAAGSFNNVRKSKISADKQAFLCELHIEYADGTSETVHTDETWEVTEDGNFRMAEWYDGETYDAAINLDNVEWKRAAVIVPRKSPVLLAQYGCPVRIQVVKKPVSCHRSPNGELIYDFGQNFAGVISADLVREQGKEIIFRHAEVLVDGELFVKSLRTAKATATYICKEGEQSYSPRLTYMGFRYVGVRGITQDKLRLTAFVLHSDFEETGSFECSDGRLNQLQSNIRWGGKSNFVDIPTDCPQRDERQGWTGDLAVFARTACFNFDMSRFLNKWLLDMRAEQGCGGGLPMVIPRAGDMWPTMASSCWGDSCILVPWAEYLARGDKQLLERHYPTMKKFLKAVKWWAGFLSFTPNGRYIWRFPFHWGDWCSPEGNAQNWILKGKWVATAYFANSCAIMAQIADLLGRSDDALYYRRLRDKIASSYRKVFTDGKGRLKKEFQTAYVLPLHFGMTEGEETKAMAKNLARLVREAGNHLTTGFTGTPYLLFALSDNGYPDVAYDLLMQDSCPSWLYEVKAGGTTIWERWDALRPDGTVNIGELTGSKSDDKSDGGMVSFNHYANGAVGDWLYRRVIGIEATSGGYKTFQIAPVVGGGLTYARGSVMTGYGEIASDWVLDDGKFRIRVKVPVNTTCTLIMPSGKEYIMGSGVHSFDEDYREKSKECGKS